MKPIVIFNSKILQYAANNVDAIILYPFVLFKKSESDVSTLLVKHQFIHIHQIHRDGFITFSLKYMYEYLKNWREFKNSNMAYLNVGYEMEAYTYQHDHFTSEEISWLLG